MITITDTFFGPMATVTTDSRISEEISRLGHWEFMDLQNIATVYHKFYGNRIGTMLDIGCNLGSWVVPMAKRYSNNKFLAFDCQQLLIDCLNQTLTLNAITNVETKCCVITDINTVLTFNPVDYTWAANFGAFEFEPPINESDFNGQRSTQVCDIEAITIDSLNLDNVSFIKLDIEGMEHKALQGAIETLKKCRPMIVFENHKTDLQAVKKLLSEINYKTHCELGQITVVLPMER